MAIPILYWYVADYVSSERNHNKYKSLLYPTELREASTVKKGSIGDNVTKCQLVTTWGCGAEPSSPLSKVWGAERTPHDQSKSSFFKLGRAPK